MQTNKNTSHASLNRNKDIFHNWYFQILWISVRRSELQKQPGEREGRGRYLRGEGQKSPEETAWLRWGWQERSQEQHNLELAG